MSDKQNRKTSSVIWKYFTVINKKNCYASCDICHKQLSYKTTTTNLRRHFLKKHPTVALCENQRTKVEGIELVNLENFNIDDTPVYTNNNESLDDISASSEEDALRLEDKRTKLKRHHLPKDQFIKEEINPIESIKGSKQLKPHKAKRKHPSECSRFLDTTDECDAYAKSLSLQLHNLDSDQRFIAEKLISEVIFCGRFGSLSRDTQLSNTNISQSIIIPPDKNDSQDQRISFNYNGKTTIVQSVNEEFDNVNNTMNNNYDCDINKKHFSDENICIK